MDSFVFYDSFLDTADCFEDDAPDFLYHAACCLLGREHIDEQPRAYAAAITQMRASVVSAKERYDKSKEDGAKGGRPSKQEYIPPEEWQAYRKDHSQEETAEHFGIALRTLQYWERKTREDAKTRKNPNVNVNDNDNVNANVNDNVIINNNKKTGSNGETSKVPVLPVLNEGERWTSDPLRVRNTGEWIAYYETAEGEERCMLLEQSAEK